MPYFIECLIFLVSSLMIILMILSNINPPPILGIYQRPNGFYWLKCLFMFTILSTRKWLNKLKGKNKLKEALDDLDKPQKLSIHEKAIDAVYFNGANKEGDYLVIGTARRHKKLVDSPFYLLIEKSGFGLLEWPQHPGTALYQKTESENYEVENLKITPAVPMEKWRIQYEGKMKRFENRKEMVDVKLDAVWNAVSPCFNFDTDMSAWGMAKSMAYETFSRDYFNNLKTNHQTHYEQHGDIEGTVSLNGQAYSIKINTLRDHSFGLKREWRNFHRYGLHFLTTENGDRINVGMICLPVSFSRLTIGYVYSAEDKKMYPVDWCDFELYRFGEDGIPPLDYAFSFSAGGRIYRMQVNVLHSPHFYISKDWEVKIFERLCTFEVNGVKGWGAAEWQYYNVFEKNVPDYDDSLVKN